MSAKTKDRRLDKEDWVDAALEFLIRNSWESVRIDSLAAHLKVTKGSFYWHFKDRNALLDAVLQRWRQQSTLDIIAQVEQNGLSAQERIERMLETQYSKPSNRRLASMEVGIREWAKNDRVVEGIVADVDEQRLRYLQGLFRQMGLDEQAIIARAYLLYMYTFAEAIIKAHETPEQERMRRQCCLAEFLRK